MKRTAPVPSIKDEMLDIAAECFEPATLNALAKMRLSPKLTVRVDQLADKSNEGELTPGERKEYRSYIEMAELLSTLQLRARLKRGLPIPTE